MSYAEQLEALLAKAIRTQNHPIGISAYQSCLDERIVLTHGAGRLQEASVDLTLHWEDRSISRHRFMLPFPEGQELPIHHWRKVRYFEQQRPALSIESMEQEKSPLVCDEQILQLREQPLETPPAEPWITTYTIHTRKFASSTGTTREEIVTEAHLKTAAPFSYSLYHRRKKPDEQELTYLREEQHWLHARRNMAPIQMKNAQKDGYLLLSPQAMRTLFHAGLAAFLLDRRKAEHLLPFIRFCADHTQLTVYSDPFKAWSPGSRLLAADGSQPEQRLLVAPGHASSSYLPRSFDPASLHLEHPKKARFHPWISAQEQVDYVPFLQLPESFSPYSQQMGLVPFCLRYTNGTPADQGYLSFPFSLAALFASPHITLVSKVGWDGFGLGVPYRDLAHNP